MVSSLISTIKQAIFTEVPSDVKIHQRSLVSMLIETNGDGDPISRKDFVVKDYRGRSLIITRYIFLLFKFLFLGLIWITYAVYNLLHKVFTGKWRGMKPSSGINIVILTIVFISGFVILIYLLLFLISDVIFAPNNAFVNHKGVVTVSQPCYETQSFFLLNSATYWTSTDIHISEGDKVYITASGSMYSDIGELNNAARDNKTLIYSRSVFGPFKPESDDTIGTQYCIYGRYKRDRAKYVEKNARFGSLLYQIALPHSGPVDYNTDNNKHAVNQVNFFTPLSKFGINKTFCFRAEKSGTLYLTFNDILLDDATIKKLIRNKPKSIWEDIAKTISFEPTCDTVDVIRKHIQNPQIWFQDNVGEVLVNIRIERNIHNSNMPLRKKIACRVFRYLDHCTTKPFWDSPLPLTIMFVTLYFLLDNSISRLFKRKHNHRNK